MDYKAREQDCIVSIAVEQGFTWEKLWHHADNAELKRTRTSPNILAPGDIVHIPDKELRAESCAAEQKHRFVKRNCLVKLRLRLLEEGKPRKGLKYDLHVDTLSFSGKTDGDGKLEHQIPANASEARLVTAQDGFVLRLGGLQPVDRNTGVQQRLRNLGYFGGTIDSAPSEELDAAIAAFQKKLGLTANGTLSEQTLKRLVQSHGS